jgi:hypothetical protein
MSRSEKTLNKDELPIYQYRLSKHAIKIFGESEVEKGVRVESILLYPHFTTSNRRIESFNRLLVSEQNLDNIVEYQVMIPKTGEIIESNTNSNNSVKKSKVKGIK